ncbi:MAG: class I SAM-dependent methyltransferase [Verrucomicrobiae bacterium]|nr:class I SAM-dependent methyltransferase [Verrucomicrobiae bacterium]
MDIVEYNRNAWNLQSMEGCRWSTPVDDDVIERAKAGDWSLILTPNKPVPNDWYPSYPRLDGVNVLALASGGGQQVPVLAAAGARVTSFDASDVQLEKDMKTAARHGFEIVAEQGNMADLSLFEDESFDLIFHPVSNVFAAEVRPVWKECARVLKPGGRLLAGFMNPCFFLFDHQVAEETGELRVIHRLPYSDLDSMDERLLSEQMEAQLSLEFSHSLEDQIGGQCDAGLAVTALYEDGWDDVSSALHQWMPLFVATRSVKVAV